MMDKAKELMLADALAEAIKRNREVIKLKRVICISLAANVALAVLLIIALL